MVVVLLAVVLVIVLLIALLRCHIRGLALLVGSLVAELLVIVPLVALLPRLPETLFSGVVVHIAV